MKKATKETKKQKKYNEESPIWTYLFIIFFIGCTIAYMAFVHIEIDPEWDEYIQSHSTTIEEVIEQGRQYDKMQEELHKPESDLADPSKNPYLSDGTEKEVY